MHLSFTTNNFIIKRKGISNDKFRQDSANRPDHRLGLAAAVVVAAHQAHTEAD